MQPYINSTPPVGSISVGMDLHKKTIVFYVFDASVGVKLYELELLHDLPRANKYY